MPRKGVSVRELKIATGKDVSGVENKQVTWDQLAKRLQKHTVYETLEQSRNAANFCGGYYDGKGKARANLIARSVLTLDYDKCSVDIDDLAFQLELSLDCTFVAYSTYRHTPENPRIRVVIPLSRDISADEYEVYSRQVADQLGIEGIDACSFVASQIMFLPSMPDDGSPWSHFQDGEFWPVPHKIEGVSEKTISDDDLSLDKAIAYQPLDIDEKEVDNILESYPPEDKDYDQWVRVGMALYHQFQGSDHGYSKWVDWSAQSPKHDAKHMPTKWRSFGDNLNPTTMASIIHLAGGRKAVVELKPGKSDFDKIKDAAHKVATETDYFAFRDKIREIDDMKLPKDTREMIANIVFQSCGKEIGLSKTSIKNAFKPEKKARLMCEGGIEPPEWLNGWIYNEKQCEFALLGADHSIKREAFRAKYDRKTEPATLETDAATYALNMVQIPTVADDRYWPGEDELITVDGMQYINTYKPGGIEPCTVVTPEGQKAVNAFLKHLENTIEHERERRIVLDFMTYVYQNPGKRVGWALLLKGIEGNGKSYFAKVMEYLMGENVGSLSTDAFDTHFNGWAQGRRMIFIEEVRVSGTNKYKILDRMKPMISNSVISVESKGKDPRTVPNFTSYMMFTNHDDAIPVTTGSRRYCVIFTRHTCEDDLNAQHGSKDGAKRYFDELFDLTHNHADALARFFSDRDVSEDFSPSGRAPVTDGFRLMLEANVSDERLVVENAIEDYASNIVSKDLIDVTHLTKEAMMGDAQELPAKKVLGHILREMGLRPIEGRRMKVSGKDHYVWFRVTRMTSDDAKDQVRRYFSGENGDTYDDFSDVPF